MTFVKNKLSCIEKNPFYFSKVRPKIFISFESYPWSNWLINSRNVSFPIQTWHFENHPWITCPKNKKAFLCHLKDFPPIFRAIINIYKGTFTTPRTDRKLASHKILIQLCCCSCVSTSPLTPIPLLLKWLRMMLFLPLQARHWSLCVGFPNVYTEI